MSVRPFRETRRAALREALIAAGGNRGNAADLLELSERTVFRWIKEFRLEAEFPGDQVKPSGIRVLKARDCLRCGKRDPKKRREPGLCDRCKRHVDFSDGCEEDYEVAL